MISKRKKVLLRSVAAAIALAALGAAVKMLVTDHWSSIDPLVSTAWTWTLAAFAWVAQPIPVPLWLLFVVPLAFIGFIALLIVTARGIAERLNIANARLNPPLPHLNEAGQMVLTIVAQNSEMDVPTYATELHRLVQLSRLACQAAIDNLLGANLINIFPGDWGPELTLTALGRRYLMHPESPLKGVV